MAKIKDLWKKFIAWMRCEDECHDGFLPYDYLALMDCNEKEHINAASFSFSDEDIIVVHHKQEDGSYVESQTTLKDIKEYIKAS